jgi:hypothetical protein
VDVKPGKKAMAAVIDAFVFITVIGLRAAGMFIHIGTDDGKGMKAKEYCNAFFSIELRMNDLFDEPDTQCVMMCDLMAAHISSDEGTVKEYAERVLDSIIPPIYSYRMVCVYDDNTLEIGDGDGNPISQYSSDIAIINGLTMYVSLSLY